MTEHVFIILLPWHTEMNISSFIFNIEDDVVSGDESCHHSESSNEDEVGEESWHIGSNVKDEDGEELCHHSESSNEDEVGEESWHTGRNVKDEVGEESYHHSESSNEDEDGKVTIESKDSCDKKDKKE